jgi:DNA replication protein DnaC
MSRKDYEHLCSELDNTRQKDHPHAYDALSQEGREALQYWIEHAIQPAQKADERHSSYGLKHEYERETKVYVSHAQFKGAMLVAGYLPIEKSEQNWHFKIKPTYDEKRFSQDVASQNKRTHLPAYRSTPQGEQDPQLRTLVQRVLASHRDDDTYAVMI